MPTVSGLSVGQAGRQAGSGRLVGLSRASFLGMLLAGGFDDSGGAVVGLALGVSFLRGEVARGLCGLLTIRMPTGMVTLRALSSRTRHD